MKPRPQTPSLPINAADAFSTKPSDTLSTKPSDTLSTKPLDTLSTKPSDTLSVRTVRRSLACSPLLSKSEDDSSQFMFDLQRSYDSYAPEKHASYHSLTLRTRTHDTPSPIQSPPAPPAFPASSLHYQFIPQVCSLSLLFTIRSVKQPSSGDPVEVLRVVRWCPSTTTLWELLHRLDELELGAECFATVLQLVRKATARLSYRVGLSVGCQH